MVIQPTCSYTIKKEYPDLLGTPEARKVAENTLDLMQMLEQLRRAIKLKADYDEARDEGRLVVAARTYPLTTAHAE